MPADLRGVRRRLPLAADVRQEPGAGSAVLGERRLVRGRRSTRRRTPRRALAAGASRRPSVSLRSRVPSTRLRRIRSFTAALQRRAAMLSPARCTTASTPSSARGSSRPRAGSHWTSVVPAVGGRRRQAVDPVPRRAQRGHERAPDEPGGAGDGDAEPGHAHDLGNGRAHRIRLGTWSAFAWTGPHDRPDPDRRDVAEAQRWHASIMPQPSGRRSPGVTPGRASLPLRASAGRT